MSKLFFDHLLDFKKLDKEIKAIAKTPEEREEIWALVDDIVHHKTLAYVLDKLDKTHHHEFLEIFYKNPHDAKIIFDFLKDKINQNIEELLRQELGNVAFDLLQKTRQSS